MKGIWLLWLVPYEAKSRCMWGLTRLVVQKRYRAIRNVSIKHGVQAVASPKSMGRMNP